MYNHESLAGFPMLHFHASDRISFVYALIVTAFSNFYLYVFILRQHLERLKALVVRLCYCLHLLVGFIFSFVAFSVLLPLIATFNTLFANLTDMDYN